MLAGFGLITYVNPRLLPWTLVYVGSGDFTYQYEDSKIQLYSISWQFTKREGTFWDQSVNCAVENKMKERLYLLVVWWCSVPPELPPHYTGLIAGKLAIDSWEFAIARFQQTMEISVTMTFILRFYECDSNYLPKDYKTGSDCVGEIRRTFNPLQTYTVTTATTQMTTRTGTVTTVTGGRTFTVTTERLRVVTVTGGSTVTVTTTYSGQVLSVPFRLSDVSLVLFVVGACLGVLALMILLLRLARSSSGKSLPRPSEARRRRK